MEQNAGITFGASLQTKRILVTGASGFIGGHVCTRLAEFGAEVHAVSRKARKSDEHRIQWWQADCRDFTSVLSIFSDVKPQIVFHLASYVVGAREINEVLPTFYDNLGSTVHILTAATDHRCERVVLAGSGEEPMIGETSAFPRSPYAAAKWGSNIYGQMFHKLFEVPVVTPRIFLTYGPNQKDLNKLVPFVILHLLRGKMPNLTSGRRRADWIYIDDVVEGLIRTAFIPGLEGCSFDLGCGSLVSVREIVEQIARIIRFPVDHAFGTLPDRPFEQERVANTEFLATRLGFRATTSLERGMEKTVEWYSQQEKLVQ